MKITATIQFRFADHDGVEAARKRAEVGAPESMASSERREIEADVSLDTLARAEAAGVLDMPQPYATDKLKIARVKSSDLYLQPEFWGLDESALLERWIEVCIVDATEKFEECIGEQLAAPVETWIDRTRGGKYIVKAAVAALWSVDRERLLADPRIVARRGEAQEEADARNRQEHRKQLDRYRQLDPAEWVRQHRIRGVTSAYDVRSNGFGLLTNDEIAERLEVLQAANQERLAEIERAKSAAEAAFGARAEDLGGDAADAASRGYSITEAVLADIMSQLTEAVGREPIAVLRDGTERYDDLGYERRDSPKADGLALESLLDAASEAVWCPACVSIDVSPVCRITLPLADEDDYTEPGTRKLTGVVVTISSPITSDRAVVFSAE